MTNRKKPPAHPGRVLLQEFMEPYGLSARKLGQMLGVPHNRITKIIRGETSVTPNTAIRLEHLFGMSAATWLNMQAAYDLAVEQLQADKKLAAEIAAHRSELNAA